MDITELVFWLFALLTALGIWRDSRGLLIAGGVVGIMLGAFFVLADSWIAAALLIIVGAYVLFTGISGD